MRPFGPYIGRRPQLSGPEADLSAVVGSEVGAFEATQDGAWRAIGIGVATGALTFVVTRLLENLLFPRRGR